MTRRGKAPDVLTVLRVEARRQRSLAERELAEIRAIHREERGEREPIPPCQGGTVDPRRNGT